MTSSASFHPEAQQELIDAAIWYDDRQEGLGDSFIDAVSARILAIREQPQRFATVHNDVRQAIVRRFPYVVYFREKGERIIVLSIFHASRDPDSLWSRMDG